LTTLVDALGRLAASIAYANNGLALGLQSPSFRAQLSDGVSQLTRRRLFAFDLYYKRVMGIEGQEQLMLRSLEFARDSTIVLLMLAVVIVGVSVTFIQGLFGTNEVQGTKQIACSWFVYLVSILCGIFVLASITGNVAIASDGGPRTVSPYEDNVAYFSTLQLLCFFVACSLMVVFGAYRLRITKRQTEAS
jgi:hypothetical protein